VPTAEEQRLIDECNARGGSWIYNPDGGGYGCTDMSNLTEAQWDVIRQANQELDQRYGPGPGPRFNETNLSSGAGETVMFVVGTALFGLALYVMLR